MQTHTIKEFIIKYTIISSIITMIIGIQLKDFIFKFISLLIDPLFSIDLNENGEPDLKEMVKYSIKIGKCIIPVGKIFLELLKLILYLVIVYYLLNFIIKNTDLVDFKMSKK